MIHAEALAQLSLLTRRSLWNLSADGYIPKAERGKYPVRPALIGLFRYYREKISRHGRLSDARAGATSASEKLKRLELKTRLDAQCNIIELARRMSVGVPIMQKMVEMDTSLSPEAKREIAAQFDDLWLAVFDPPIVSEKLRRLRRRYAPFLEARERMASAPAEEGPT